MVWESSLQQGFSTFFQPLTLSTLDLESSDKAYRVLLKKAVCIVPRPVGSSEAKRNIPPASKAKKPLPINPARRVKSELSDQESLSH